MNDSIRQIPLPLILLLLTASCASPPENRPAPGVAEPASAAADTPAPEPAPGLEPAPGPSLTAFGAVELSKAGPDTVRLTVRAHEDANVWSSGAALELGDGYQTGETLRISLAARSVQDIAGIRIPVLLELADAPYTKFLEAGIEPGHSFSPYLFEGTVTGDTAGKPLKLVLHLGTREGVLEIRNLDVTRIPGPDDAP